MEKFKQLRKLAGVVGMVMLFAGCATQQQVTRHFYWPPLPERPRIEWLKAYYSQQDFPKSSFDKFLTGIAGEEESLSFNKPLDIKSNGKGTVYVTDAGLQGVVVYDLVNHDVHMLGRDDAPGLFRQVAGVTVDDVGNIYASDAEKNLVLVFTPDEKPLRTINLAGHVVRGGGLAIDAKRQHLYVVDTRGHKIVVFDLGGKYLFSFGKRGDGDGMFNYPVDAKLDSKGELVVADAMNARIQIFDADGKFLRKFGQRGDGPGDFQIIKAVAIDSDNDIYVTDGKGNKLEIYSTNGDYLLTVGGLYSVLQTGKEAPGGFLIPQGIDIDRNDTIYVVDQLNRRFQVFQYISDRYLREHPIPGIELK